MRANAPTDSAPGASHSAPPAAAPGDATPLALAPLTLRFSDPARERAFGLYQNDQVLPQVRILALVAFGLFVLSVVVDHFFPHPNEMEPWLRYPALLGTLAGFGLTFTTIFRRWLQVFVGLGVLAVGLTFAYQFTLTDGTTVYLYGILEILVMIIAYFLSGLHFRWAFAASAVYTGAFAAVVLGARPIGPTETAAILTFVFSGFVLTALAGYMLERYRRISWHQRLVIEEERARSEALLLNILPRPIAERMKRGAGVIADEHERAAILFIDIVGFTPLSAKLPPDRLVAVLNAVFSQFDDIADAHAVEKIKTIGDAYMVAAGLPEDRGDALEALAEAALGMLEAVQDVDLPDGETLALRMGLHVGPVVAGVIGKRKFVYDLWGDTVNTASRMESHGAPGRIHVTQAVRDLLADRFAFADRGEIDIKGKGMMRTYFLTGRRG